MKLLPGQLQALKAQRQASFLRRVAAYAQAMAGQLPDNALRVATPNDPKGYVEWGCHVAPTVQVVGKDGKTHPMVIDPSIATTPITPAQWKALQSQPESSLVLTSAKPYYRAEDGRVAATPDNAAVQATFDQHRMARAANFPPSK